MDNGHGQGGIFNVISNFAAAVVLAVSATPAQSLSVQAFPDRGEPIAAEAYTDDLVEAEYENGRLTAELLVSIESSAGCLLEREAAESWLRLEIHAAHDGVELIPRWCYRNLANQRRTYQRNCPRRTVVVDPPPVTQQPPAGGEEPVVQNDEAEPPTAAPQRGPRVCTVPTAKPGNSNHGWGRAIDIKIGGRLLTCESEAFEWLVANAHVYGWVHPEWAACDEPQQEAWHWEWGGTLDAAPTLTRLRNFTA